MDEIPAGIVLQEVALNLHTDVAPVRGMRPCPVRETGEFLHALCHPDEALVNGMTRVVESKRILELAGLHAEEIILLPFDKEIQHARGCPEGGGVTVELQLCFPKPVVQNAAVEGDTSQTEVKGIRLACRTVVQAVILILHDSETRQLHVVDPFLCLRMAEGRAQHYCCKDNCFSHVFVFR